MLYISKWLIVVSLGLSATACTIATVDLRQDMQEVEEITDHLALPWRMVPPIKVSLDDVHRGVDYTRTTTGSAARYAAAADAGKWPLNIGLEYACFSRNSVEHYEYAGKMAEADSPPRHYSGTDSHVFFSLGGFTPDIEWAALEANGVKKVFEVTSSEGKWLIIEDAAEFLRDARGTITVYVDERDPDRGYTFELDGAAAKFKAVDRLCHTR